jgi:curved DNA-binding protein
MSRDYYEILGLSRNAADAEIKRAYRRLVKQYHPDRNKGNKDAEAKFKEVQEAYDCLSDAEKRAQYDRFGQAGPASHFDPRAGNWTYTTGPGGGQTIDIGDLQDLFDFGSARGGGSPGGVGSIFEQLFRQRGGAGPSRTPVAEPEPTRDIDHTVTLTFDQAIHGTTLELQLDTGRGRPQHISVHIPPGVRDGQRIRVRGKGQPGRGRQPAGDLYVTCHVTPHAYFERRGDDIYLDVPITVGEAALGAKIDLPTIDGVRTVTIPPGTASGAKLRLAGLGVPSASGGKRGDHYAVIKIVSPAKLTAEQRELFEKLSRTNLGSPRDGLWR